MSVNCRGAPSPKGMPGTFLHGLLWGLESCPYLKGEEVKGGNGKFQFHLKLWGSDYRSASVLLNMKVPWGEVMAVILCKLAISCWTIACFNDILGWPARACWVMSFLCTLALEDDFVALLWNLQWRHCKLSEPYPQTSTVWGLGGVGEEGSAEKEASLLSSISVIAMKCRRNLACLEGDNPAGAKNST